MHCLASCCCCQQQGLQARQTSHRMPSLAGMPGQDRQAGCVGPAAIHLGAEADFCPVAAEDCPPASHRAQGMKTSPGSSCSCPGPAVSSTWVWASICLCCKEPGLDTASPSAAASRDSWATQSPQRVCNNKCQEIFFVFFGGSPQPVCPPQLVCLLNGSSRPTGAVRETH